ncbi:MAG: hypothetical protein EOP53_14695 [Sphingobacteriales bacterium]|nr:MAG: hypothetical protein EOP53_14695 [Sphingobacteriales bacterium]
MKTPFTYFFLFFLLLGTQTVYAQKFEVPKEYTLKAPEDFTKYKDQVVAAVNWMNRTPLATDTAKRSEVNAFVLAWISGNPDLTISLHQNIVSFAEINPQLLIIFMGGWAKFAIINPTDMTNIKGNLAGLRAVFAFYDKNQELTPDKSLEKLIKLNEDGLLRKWIAEQLKS